MNAGAKPQISLPGKIEHWKTEDLTPYANNAKIHTESQIGAIAWGMLEFGFNNPVLVRPDGSILAGHGRVLAAKLIGRETVPVVVQSHLTDDQARAYIIADNRLAETGWDEELLVGELMDLQLEGIELANLGFDEEEIDQFLSGVDPDIEWQDPVPKTNPEERILRISCPQEGENALRQWLQGQLLDSPVEEVRVE